MENTEKWQDKSLYVIHSFHVKNILEERYDAMDNVEHIRLKGLCCTKVDLLVDAYYVARDGKRKSNSVVIDDVDF